MSRLIRIGFGYLAVWMAFALFTASHAYRADIAYGCGALPGPSILEFQLVSALIWAVFTPIVVGIGERLSFQAHKLRDAVLLAAIVPLLAVVRAAAGAMVLMLSDTGVIRMSTIEMSIGIRFHGDVFRILVIMGLTRVVYTWNELQRRETHALELTASLARARFDELHSRLQTGFLVQTLHTLGHRIRRNDPSSEALIVALCDLLRQVLQAARQVRTTLEGELDLLDRYLLFHELLSGRRIQSRYEFDERLLSAEVPLMMLHPLFTEAIAGASGRALHITVRGRVEEGMLKLEVEDDAGASPRTEMRHVRARVKKYLSGASFDSETRALLHTTRIELPFAAGAVAP